MRNASIAENIAAGRRELGITQAALAERVGVTKTAVSKWEKGPVDSPSLRGGSGRSVIALILASTALQAFAFAVPGDVLTRAARGGGRGLPPHGHAALATDGTSQEGRA